jgi:4-aminobutyrate aminotransferase-like enzyme
MDSIKPPGGTCGRGVGQFIPGMIGDAKGVMVRDAEGKEFPDFFRGIRVLNAGHGPDEVVDAIRDQGANTSTPVGYGCRINKGEYR